MHYSEHSKEKELRTPNTSNSMDCFLNPPIVLVTMETIEFDAQQMLLYDLSK